MAESIIIPPGAKAIPLTHGQFAIVDEADYDSLMRYKWHYRPNGYAARLTRDSDPNPRKSMMMHRQIMNTPADKITDHINHDKLDNRRCNLRICTDRQNMYNRYKNRDCPSQHKGVTWYPKTRKWKAEIYYDQKSIFLGYYKLEIDAALAYNAAAEKMHGEFILPNRVEVPEGHIPEGKRECSSPYLGVCWHKTLNKWFAKITHGGKQIWLGAHATENEAALAIKQRYTFV